MSSTLTDGWGELLDALQNVRSFAKDELAKDETAALNEIIGAVSLIIYR